ncbi:MAG: hypothetical protein A2Y12_17250 [Planctomycetes bacterium GWF2_42_9]|nr:MAG: hypothetical protein A2Y12_17250 [Planctomycetes bacterium GWF2_42_9]
MIGGKKIWYFPDGYLPEKNNKGSMEAHEALMLLNTSNIPIEVKLDIYYSDKEADKDIKINVGAERIIALRLDKPSDIGGIKIPPLTQYAIRVRADRPIVAQFGRLDTTQDNMAYYGCMGYCEND